jgi:hypothetical protein
MIRMPYDGLNKFYLPHLVNHPNFGKVEKDTLPLFQNCILLEDLAQSHRQEAVKRKSVAH